MVYANDVLDTGGIGRRPVTFLFAFGGCESDPAHDRCFYVVPRYQLQSQHAAGGEDVLGERGGGTQYVRKLECMTMGGARDDNMNELFDREDGAFRRWT